MRRATESLAGLALIAASVAAAGWVFGPLIVGNCPPAPACVRTEGIPASIAAGVLVGAAVTIGLWMIDDAMFRDGERRVFTRVRRSAR